MINVTKITVRSFDLDRLDIYWEIDQVAAPPLGSSTQHEIYNYTFQVLRSEAAVGPFDALGTPLQDSYHFRDVEVHLLHKWRQYFYKIRVTNRTTGETKDFGPAASLEPEGDLIAHEIIRQEDLLFREFIGRKCFLFPVRTFGPRCSCFDPVAARRTRSSCNLCFGTGYLGGFMSPVEVFVQIDPFPKKPQASSLQEIQASDTTARMISFPPVSPRDILVESENRRWRVEAVSATQRLRATVRQELQIHEIPKGDIEYAIPVNIDQRALKPSAERNFTNPQNLDNEDFSDIFAVFGHPRGALR